jgi:hypothetical protein
MPLETRVLVVLAAWLASVVPAREPFPAPRAPAAIDPFAPHVRWVEAAPASAPWIPRSVAFAAGGELVLGAGSLGAPQALALASADLTGNALIGTQGFPGALGTVSVAAGATADALYVQSQHASPTASERVTRVARVAGLGGTPGLSWSTDVGPVGNGAARLVAPRGGLAVIAAVEAGAPGGAVHVAWLEAASGAELASAAAAGGSLRELAASDDGSRVALLAGPELWVLDAAAAVLHRETLPMVTNALALSGDGRTLVVGSAGGARVIADGAAGFAEQASVAAAPGEVAVCAALAVDGSRWAIGWWDQQTGQRVRFQVRDAGGGLLHELVQAPGALGLQNYPEAVAITPDGRRAAYGAWGVGDGQAELALVEVDGGGLLLSIDLPGSVQALALSDCGTRLAAGVKHAHANQFAATGELVLHDTGERELQVLARALPQGKLELASLHGGATRALFLIGTPLSSPVTFGGAGELWIDRGQPMRVKFVLPDASGRADVSVAVPPLLAGLGAGLAVQAAWRAGGSLVLGMRVDPLIL